MRRQKVERHKERQRQDQVSFFFCFLFFFLFRLVRRKKKTNDGFAFSRALALPSFYRVVEMLEIVGFTCHRFFIFVLFFKEAEERRRDASRHHQRGRSGAALPDAARGVASKKAP